MPHECPRPNHVCPTNRTCHGNISATRNPTRSVQIAQPQLASAQRSLPFRTWPTLSAIDIRRAQIASRRRNRNGMERMASMGPSDRQPATKQNIRLGDHLAMRKESCADIVRPGCNVHSNCIWCWRCGGPNCRADDVAELPDLVQMADLLRHHKRAEALAQHLNRISWQDLVVRPARIIVVGLWRWAAIAAEPRRGRLHHLAVRGPTRIS